MDGVKHRVVASSALGVLLVACTASPSIGDGRGGMDRGDEMDDLDELDERGVISVDEGSALDARPLLPAPRSSTDQGCQWLDPVAQGARIHEGEIFDSIAHAMATWDLARPRLRWIQRAESPGPAPGHAFYVANAGGRLRWCYVQVDPLLGAVVCDRQVGYRRLVVARVDEGRPAVDTARVFAMLDHAVQLYESSAQAERCTPAPASVVASIAAPAWVQNGESWHLEFVEQVNPRTDLARLVRVRVGPNEVRHTELWSWNPQQVH
ncbi:MAG: hypothetical protein AAGF11_06140 [Myxococcota bacterium]